MDVCLCACASIQDGSRSYFRVYDYMNEVLEILRQYPLSAIFFSLLNYFFNRNMATFENHTTYTIYWMAGNIYM